MAAFTFLISLERLGNNFFESKAKQMPELTQINWNMVLWRKNA